MGEELVAELLELRDQFAVCAHDVHAKAKTAALAEPPSSTRKSIGRATR